MLSISVKNLEDTNRLSYIISKCVKNKITITLNGDLASGKTTFTKYFAKNLNILDTITSPTFNIIKEYSNEECKFYHIDAYRLENSEEDLGFDEIFYEDNSIVIIEWGEFIEEFLPNNRINIDISLSGKERNFKISSIGNLYNYVIEEIEKKW